MASNYICSCQYPNPYSCNSAQNYCGPQPELATANKFRALNAQNVARDDIIIKKVPRAELNRWIQYVKDADKYKSGVLGEGPGNRASNTGASTAAESRDFMYGQKVADLIKDMTNLNGGNNPGVSPARDKIVYASDINKIINKLNALKLNPSGCPSCVTSCNVSACKGSYYRAC